MSIKIKNDIITMQWYNSKAQRFFKERINTCVCGEQCITDVLSTKKGVRIECYNCKLSTAYYPDHFKAIKAWNSLLIFFFEGKKGG